MQSNTTGHSMEIFFDVIQFVLIASLVATNYVIYSKFLKNLDEQSKLNEDLCANIDEIEMKTVKMSGQLDSIQSDMHRSLLAMRESLEAAKPMKSNNWDSVREAFKGPARIEVNERN